MFIGPCLHLLNSCLVFAFHLTRFSLFSRCCCLLWCSLESVVWWRDQWAVTPLHFFSQSCRTLFAHYVSLLIFLPDFTHTVCGFTKGNWQNSWYCVLNCPHIKIPSKVEQQKLQTLGPLLFSQYPSSFVSWLCFLVISVRVWLGPCWFTQDITSTSRSLDLWEGIGGVMEKA